MPRSTARTTGVPARAFTALALAATVLLTACATASRQSVSLPSVEIPSTWTASAPGGNGDDAGVRLSTWWTGFGDPLLTTLINDTLANNTSVEGAIASLRQARALRDVAAAGLAPTASGSASAQRSRSGNNPPTNLFKAGVDASWEPDVFGGQQADVSARDADVQARAATLDDARVSVVAETGLAYLQLRSAQERLAIATSNLSAQRETLQIAQWRSQAGLASSLDVEQARAASLQTQSQLPTLTKSIAQLAHSLSLLTGRPPTALQDQLAEAKALPVPPDGFAVEMPADVLRRRPDVRAAEWGVRAAAAGVDAAEAARLPSFRIGGSLGLNALTLGSLTGSGAIAGALLASVSFPMFDGGAARAQVRAQDAALDKSRADYRAAVLGALSDVEGALVALRDDRIRLDTLRAVVDTADRSALLARQRYASGLIDFQSVLETQRTLLGSQDGLASATADVAADHVRLFKALGGGWSAPTDRPATALAPDALSSPPRPNP